MTSRNDSLEMKFLYYWYQVCSKQAGVGLVTEAEILTLLECLLQAKALSFSTLTVVGDSATVISWVINNERGT